MGGVNLGDNVNVYVHVQGGQSDTDTPGDTILSIQDGVRVVSWHLYSLRFMPLAGNNFAFSGKFRSCHAVSSVSPIKSIYLMYFAVLLLPIHRITVLRLV
jgi:hypothetical protein